MTDKAIEIVARLRAGHRICDVSRELGVSRQTVSRYARINGIAPREPAPTRSEALNIMVTPAELQRLKDAATFAGDTVSGYVRRMVGL